MRELVIFWKRDVIKLLPYLDDFMFMKRGFWQSVHIIRGVERDFVRARLRINPPKCHSATAKHLRHLDFVVDIAEDKL